MLDPDYRHWSPAAVETPDNPDRMTQTDLVAYAARTGTKRNLTALRAAKWRLLVSASGVMRHEGFPYALDNGAWHAYQHGTPWNERTFTTALRALGADADWTVLPDLVAGGLPSLELSLRWMQRVLDASPAALLAVQDGMTAEDVRPFLGQRVGIFVGGSTAWKEQTMGQWGALGRQVGCWVHVGRVNTARRLHRCALAGVTSFDGSSVSRYAATLPLLEHARHQLPLFTWEG